MSDLSFKVQGVNVPLPQQPFVMTDPVAIPAPPPAAPQGHTAAAAVAIAPAPATALQLAPAKNYFALPSIEELLEGRTRDQREAILHGEGPLLIFAGPGAGKTATLTRRIAYLLASGLAEPEEILAVTFTVRAADEMRERLIPLIGTERTKRVTVATYHSVCSQMVRKYAANYGRDGSYSIHDQTNLGRRIKRLMNDSQLTRVRAAMEQCGETPVKEIVKEISAAKNKLWTPDIYLEHAKHPVAPVIGEVWRELERDMRESNCFDFDDLLRYAVDLLARFPHARAFYREQWKWMLVDEFQDTNVAQMELVKLLQAPHGNLTVVGDDDQSIYRFRCADVENILRFSETFTGARTITLGHNFRSRAEVVAAASRCVAHNGQRAPKGMVAVRGTGGRVDVVSFPDEHEEARAVRDMIVGQIGLGTDPREILVLSRTGYLTQGLQNRLTESDVPFRMVGGRSLWERVEVGDAMAYLTLLANPSDALAFHRVVRSPTSRKPFSTGGVKAPSRGVGDTLDLLVDYARHNQIDLIDACTHAPTVRGLPSTGASNLAKLGGELNEIRRQMIAPGEEALSLGRTVINALQVSGGIVRAYQALAAQAQDARVRADANRVLDDLRSLCRAAQNYETQNDRATLAGFLEHSGIGSTTEVDAEHDNRLTISTVHGSKGTEAQLVIVMGCEDGTLPSWRAVDSIDAGDIEEERRLAYVAFTRAKDRLLLTWAGERNDRETNGASRFLTEAGLRA